MKYNEIFRQPVSIKSQYVCNHAIFLVSLFVGIHLWDVLAFISWFSIWSFCFLSLVLILATSPIYFILFFFSIMNLFLLISLRF